MTAYPNLKGSLTLPQIVTHLPQPVLVRRAEVPMDSLATNGPATIDAVRDVMAAQGIAATGPGFLRYDRISMACDMQMAFGYPVAPGTTANGDLSFETLPAGRYISIRHHGHPDELYDVTIMLIEWSKVRKVQWDVEETPEGDRFGARMEIFHNDAGPPSDDWITEIRIRLRD
ncbi:MAG: GyrI-like domain-containing protein [Tabrizicola sp.]|jgi:effector-binding domain-containing protein|nr:GyrI-like domain-containing protein [Tabrizicola sp.]